MNKEKFRKYVYGEPKEIPKMTPEKAFEEGRKVAKGKIPLGMTGYDAGGRCLCRAIIAFAKREPEKWSKIMAFYKDFEVLKKENFKTPKEAQQKAIEILKKNGYKRIKKYPTWNYDRLLIHSSWDLEAAIGQLRQGVLGTIYNLLDEIMDEELKTEMNRVGPTGFMWSWAVNSAVYLFKD